MNALRRGVLLLCALTLPALLICCGKQTRSSAMHMSSPSLGASYSGPPNACPVDGCQVRITAAERAGDEIRLTFEANYTPDVSRNHFHVFWDTYSAKQVSVDAQSRFGLAVGDWVPTADNPFTTTGPASVRMRGQSTTLCVTAGDRNHNVIDPGLVDCRDVSALLGPG